MGAHPLTAITSDGGFFWRKLWDSMDFVDVSIELRYDMRHAYIFDLFLPRQVFRQNSGGYYVHHGKYYLQRIQS